MADYDELRDLRSTASLGSSRTRLSYSDLISSTTRLSYSDLISTTTTRYDAVHDTETATVVGSDYEKSISSKTALYSPYRRAIAYSWWRRMGYFNLVALGCGTFIILFSCAFLIFFWNDAEASKRRVETNFWKAIVRQGWATRYVTICAAAIRASMGVQITFIVSALAAAILETSGTNFHDTAVFSVGRVTSSPFSLLPAAWRRSAAGGISGQVHCFMIVAAFILILASTFTSTILLSDFNMRNVAVQNLAGLINIGSDLSSEYVTGASHWKSRPSANWRFAETKLGKPLTQGISDTGDTYRALLPFSDAESRTSLERYAGPAMVTNFRTICTSPTLDNLHFGYSLNYRGSEERALYLRGKVHADLDGVLDTKKGDMLDFECRIQTAWNTTNSKVSPFSFCTYPNSTLRRGSSMEDRLAHEPYKFWPVMLFNATPSLFTGRTLLDADKTPEIPRHLQNLTTRKKEHWTKASSGNRTEVLSATVCFINNSPQMYDVIMSGHTIPSEPALNWRRSEERKNYKEILQQLGIGTDADTSQKRGILDLKILSRPMMTSACGKSKSSRDDVVCSPTPDSLLGHLLSESSASGGWSLNDDDFLINVQSNWTPHMAHTSIFQGIMQQTQNPALAIQSLLFRLYQMVYYDQLDSSDAPQSVITTNSVNVYIPTQWTGLVTVAGLVTLHFCLLYTAICLFALGTKVSLLGNAWQAVSQMVSPHTEKVMEIADGMRDQDVAEFTQSNGLHVGLYGISRPVGRERTMIELH